MAFTGNLLATTLQTVIIAVVCVVFGIAALIGVFRKFSRMSWTSWQLLILFALFMLFDKINLAEGAKGYAVAVGLGFALIVIVLAVGGFVRGYMRKRTKRAPVVLRVFDRLLGVVTAALDLAVFALVIGGFVLAVCQNLPFGGDSLSFLDPVYGSGIWAKIGTHAGDFLLIAVLTLSVKGGYRLGLGRFLWAGFTILLSFVAFYGAIYLVIKVPFLISFANKLSALIHLNDIAAWIIGRAIASLIVFLVFFIVIILINLLINFIFKKVNKVRALNYISGCILAVLFFAFCVAGVTVVYFGIHYLTTFTENESLAMIGAYAEVVEEIFTSFSYSRLLYKCNPLLALIG